MAQIIYGEEAKLHLEHIPIFFSGTVIASNVILQFESKIFSCTSIRTEGGNVDHSAIVLLYTCSQVVKKVTVK